MAVREGYKQTEVGVIPEDWDVVSLENLCLPKGLVRGPFGGALKKEFFVQSGYKVYEQRNAIYKDIQIGSYYVDKSKYIELNRFAVLAGDMIISCSGTIGRIYKIPKKHEQGIINQALLKITLDLNKVVDDYFEQYFSWEEFQKKIIDHTQGGAMKNLVGMDIFKNTPFPIPPLPEQQAIATAFSDIDGLINSLTKLIKKKKNIKQGAMQELLTGKKRLDGFSGVWEFTSLENVCTVFCDGDWIESKDQSHTGIRLIQTGNVGLGKYLDKQDKKRFISKVTFENLRCEEVFEGDILISRLPEPAGRACIIPKNSERMITAVDCTIVRFTDGYNPYFFLYYSQTAMYANAVDIALSGSTRQRISRSELGRIVIPNISISEQNAIADIIYSMDMEIDNLERKLNKYKAIKQGMMQELLTGRIRLLEGA